MVFQRSDFGKVCRIAMRSWLPHNPGSWSDRQRFFPELIDV